MKKILLFLGAAVSATSLFGAAVNWTANNIAGKTDGDDLTTYTVYFIQETTTADVAAAIEAGTFGELANKTEGTITAKTGRVTTYQAAGSATTSLTTDDGDYTSVLVMFNADKTYYTAMANTAQVSEALGEASFGFNGLGASTTWAPVPEPVSAALLLLGVAGLALKRKVA